MPSIHRQTGRPFWFCAFSIVNPETGARKRCFRSTKTRDKKQALEICRTWHKAALRGRNGKLTPEVAREIISHGVADVFAATNPEALQRNTVRAHFQSWLTARQIETTPATFDRYKLVVNRFLDFLGKSADKDMAELRAADVTEFRNEQAKALSVASANLALKVLRACCADAVRLGIATNNVARNVKILKRRGESRRRELTVAEIKRVLAACGESEWRGLILFGIYTGQRLGDLARLTWRAINLESGEVALTTRKTARRLVLPLLPPLTDYLSTLPAGDDPDAHIFPRAASANRTGTLSNQFYEILVAAGLAEPRRHASTGKGRGAQREISEISFHSLRHSAVTFLKAAGVSDALAREIVGHESAAVSRQYTHIAVADLRKAMRNLPDVTKT
jgi:integrase